MSFDDVVWPQASIAASGALLYNDSRPDKPVVAALRFQDTVRSVNGEFRVSVPPDLIRLS